MDAAVSATIAADLQVDQLLLQLAVGARPAVAPAQRRRRVVAHLHPGAGRRRWRRSVVPPLANGRFVDGVLLRPLEAGWACHGRYFNCRKRSKRRSFISVSIAVFT